MSEHSLDIQTGSFHLEGHVHFNGDQNPRWTSTNVDLKLIETQFIQSILNCANEIFHKCDGITKIEIRNLE